MFAHKQIKWNTGMYVADHNKQQNLQLIVSDNSITRKAYFYSAGFGLCGVYTYQWEYLPTVDNYGTDSVKELQN